MLSKGANPSLRQEPRGTAAVHRAACVEGCECLQMLLDTGVDPNTPSSG